MPKVFEVENILKKRVSKNSVEYLIKWKYYPVEDSTWEPLENLSTCMKKITEFESRSSNKKENKFMKENYLSTKRKKPTIDQLNLSTVQKKCKIATKSIKNSTQSSEENEKSQSDESENFNDDKVSGNFQYDVPCKIDGAKMNSKNEILLEIKWNKRYDNSIPKNSLFSMAKLRKINPILLIDFFESRLKFKK